MTEALVFELKSAHLSKGSKESATWHWVTIEGPEGVFNAVVDDRDGNGVYFRYYGDGGPGWLSWDNIKSDGYTLVVDPDHKA